MSAPPLPPLLLAALALFTSLSGTAALLLASVRRRGRVLVRFEQLVAPYQPAVAAGQKRGALAGSAAALGDARRRLLALFGVRAERRDEWPVPWWLVLLLGLVAARLWVGILATVFGGWALLLLPAAWVLQCQLFFRHCHARRTQMLYRQFPDALGMIVRSVRVGIPVAEAIRAVARDAPAPTNAEFGRVADRIAVGVALDEGLREMAERSSLTEYRFFATALTLQSQTGGGLSEALENIADVIRKRLALRERAIALASEARTSANILAALPVLTGLALTAVNRDYAMLLITDPSGKRVLGVACLMLAGGIGIMRLIISKSLSS